MTVNGFPTEQCTELATGKRALKRAEHIMLHSDGFMLVDESWTA